MPGRPVAARHPDPMRDVPSLLAVLLRRAEHEGARTALSFLPDGHRLAEAWSYGELDRRARAVAVALRGRAVPGDRCLLLLAPGSGFASGFLGCVYAGLVAVPVPPPSHPRHGGRIRAVLHDAAPTVVLCDDAAAEWLAERSGLLPRSAALLRLQEAADAASTRWDAPRLDRESLALLQYTSGSTSEPRGVMVTHGNLLYNSAYIRRGFRHTAESVSVSWLPPFHDMGLVDGLLQPLYSGFPAHLMPPEAFLRRPAAWLEAVSRFGATHTGGPNFAYDLCIDRLESGERASLELGSWRVAYCGAEPVRPGTLRRFAEAFAESGFRAEALYPCYGLAEATLKVSGGPMERGMTAVRFLRSRLEHSDEAAPSGEGEGGRELAGCGVPDPESTVLIVHPDHRTVLPPGRVGEVWIAGPGVASGYWGQPEATEATFGAQLAGGDARRFLRTGDLAFVHEGELYPVGRIKELIILRGRNLHPHDVERCAEASHRALRPGCSAAFAVAPGEDPSAPADDGPERLVVVHELRDGAEGDPAPVFEAVRRAVAVEFATEVHRIVLVARGTVPKTSSGKIRRHACRRALLAAELPVLAEWRAPDAPAPDDPLPVRSTDEVEAWIRGFLRSRLGDAAADAARTEPLAALGMDSLLIAGLAADLERRTGVRIPAERAQRLTAPGIARRVAARARRAPAPPAPGTDAPGGLPALTSAERALWLLSQGPAGEERFLLAVAVRFPAPVDVERLTSALDALAARHPALRSVFEEVDGEPRRRLLPALPGGLRVADASGWSPGEWAQRLERAAAEPLDLVRGPLFRPTLLRGRDDAVLLLQAHHVVVDFASLRVLLRELAALYADGGGALPPPADPATPARLEAALLDGTEERRAAEYWRRALDGAPAVLRLPLDRPRPLRASFVGAAETLALDGELRSAVEETARSSSTTPFAVLLAAWAGLLARYSGQGEAVVGVPAACRDHPDLRDAVGFLVNPVPVRVALHDDPPGDVLLERAARAARRALARRSFPFERVVRETHPPRLPGVSPVFQTLFVLHPLARGEEAYGALALGTAGPPLREAGVVLEPVPLPVSRVPADLVLAAAPAEEGLALSLQYRRDLFEPARVRRMLEHFRALLAELVEGDRSRPLSRIPLSSPSERRRLLGAWSGTPSPPVADTLHGAFERQAARTPTATAVVAHDGALTFAELDGRADAIAHRVRGRGVRPGGIVAVAVGRGVSLPAALLGVLKAGCAYLPVDPADPAGRVASVLSETGAGLLLTDGEPPCASVPVLRLDAADPPADARGATPPRAGEPGGLAYVLSTSGSSGRPKAVGVEHASAATLLQWGAEHYPPHERLRVLATTPTTFDVSVFELFGPLCWGGTVLLATDLFDLYALPSGWAPTLVSAVPSALAEVLRDVTLPPSVRAVNLAGEPLPATLVRQIHEQAPGVRVVDLYGPTECTVYATCATRSPDGVETIGRPIAGTRTYLLDERMEPVPDGEPGELYLGGPGVARGYLGRPGFTAERFLPDPFGGSGGARLFRTGDLARFLSDGSLVFLGRGDRQVKLRGRRVEPGEVEHVLAEHPGVEEVRVAVAGSCSEDRRLVAHLALRPGSSPEEVRAHARRRLPPHLVPAALHVYPRLPRTASGKVDLVALAAAAGAQPPDSAVPRRPPRTPAESGLAELWRELLGVEEVGIDDDFFEMGGHSLLAMRLAARIRARWGARLGVDDLLQAPTIAGVAALLEGRGGDDAPVLIPRAVPLTGAAVERLRTDDDLPVVDLPGGAA